MSQQSSVPSHPCYSNEEGVKPANSKYFKLTNQYPDNTNIISGFNGSERFFKIQEPGNSKFCLYFCNAEVAVNVEGLSPSFYEELFRRWVVKVDGVGRRNLGFGK